MGFFDFLKKFDSKKQEVKEIELEKLEGWIDSYFKEIFEKTKLELMDIRKRIDEEKNNMQENIQKLKEAKINNTNISGRFKQIMEGNMNAYMSKLNILLNKIDLPKEFDEILKFCDSFDKDLDHFSESTKRNYYISREFFEREVGAISVNIRDLSNSMKRMKKIVKESKIEQIKELKDEIKELQQKLKLKDKLKEEIKSTKEELEKEKKKIDEKESKIKELEEGSDHKKFIKLTNEVKVLEQEREELEGVQFNYFSVIKTALKKYEKLDLKNKLVGRYLNDSLRALLEDKELKIVNLIDKIKESIVKGELELKEKKKKRILLELNKSDVNYFKSFLDKHNELNKKLKNLNLEIKKIDVIEKIGKIKEELKRSDSKVKNYNYKVKEMIKELEKIDIKVLEKDLEKNIKENIDEEIKVI